MEPHPGDGARAHGDRLGGAGSAAGAAVLAAAALGGETIGVVAERFAGRRSTVDPDEALRDPLEERYHLFCAALGRDGGENPV
ncbi:hypothetical protein GCM10025881_18360 [Pseudolysinimonas kribbensis]|uniref:Carbohydrate kinase FGGY C-terminal domain-containing protein n=1 Tax=Pseudolysinimonas kribbensis TaxID=433641 RepID=A0ABQ6K876_9MICO|nr:hypothetical protein [Pseudolysinimonas kribbensis]GMA95012.1 hypothetical protein GCM10025881_18360 [Pseudolysinimonas kribbensis]